MENECSFPVTVIDRPVSESSGFPILEESRFTARNIQDQCGGVEGVWEWKHQKEPRCGKALLFGVSCPLCHCKSFCLIPSASEKMGIENM